MKSTLIDFSGKLPHGLVELYACVDGAAKRVDVPFLIVGAMARDLIMVHGFGAQLERGTRDVDFAVDLDYLLRTYVAIPAVENAVFETEVMEACDWDQDLASAIQLGCDTGAIASSESRKFIERFRISEPSPRSLRFRTLHKRRRC